MTSAGKVSEIPKLRKFREFPSSLDCLLCSLTRETNFALAVDDPSGVNVEVKDI
jgi:hypothetical protein